MKDLFELKEDVNHNIATLARDLLQEELAVNVYNVCVKYIVVCKLVNLLHCPKFRLSTKMLISSLDSTGQVLLHSGLMQGLWIKTEGSPQQLMAIFSDFKGFIK